MAKDYKEWEKQYEDPPKALEFEDWLAENGYDNPTKTEQKKTVGSMSFEEFKSALESGKGIQELLPPLPQRGQTKRLPSWVVTGQERAAYNANVLRQNAAVRRQNRLLEAAYNLVTAPDKITSTLKVGQRPRAQRSTADTEADLALLKENRGAPQAVTLSDGTVVLPKDVEQTILNLEHQQGMQKDQQQYTPEAKLGGLEDRALAVYKNRKVRIQDRRKNVINNLQDTSWDSLTKDRKMAEADLDWMIERAERSLANLKPTDPMYQKTQRELDELREMKGLFKTRADYAGKFNGEDDYSWMQEAERGVDMYRQAGKTAEDYYVQTTGDMNAAKQRYKQAEADYNAAKARLDDLSNLASSVDYSTDRNGVLTLPDGRAIRGQEDINNYIAKQAAEIKADIQEKDEDLQTAAAEYKRTQGVYSYAKAYQYSDIADRPNYQKELAAGKRKYQQLQEKVENQRAQRADEVRQGNVEVAGLSNEELAGEDYYTFRMPTNAWSQQDIDTYCWLLGQSEDKAEAYAIDVNFSRLLGIRTKEQEKTSEWAHDNPFWGGLAGTASRVATSPTGLWDYFGDLAQYGNTGLVMPRAELSVRDYANALSEGAARRFNEAGTIGAGVPVLGGKGMGDLYQLGNSIAESLAWGAVGKGMGAVGAPDKLVSATINLGFFGNAASEATQQALTRGATPEQALGIGAMAGAAEALGETMSVENLIHMKDPAHVAQAMLNILTQAGIEGSEEGVTTLINTFSEALVYGDKSDLNQAYLDNLASGMSRDEAKRAAWSAWAEDLAFDVFGGMLSGGISASGNMAAGQFAAGVEQAKTRQFFQNAARAYSEQAAVGSQLKLAFGQSKIDISDADMKILTDGYIEGETDQTSYVIAMRDGYRLGKAGKTLSEARKSSQYANQVFEQQFRHAWELGSRAGGNDPAALRGNIPSSSLRSDQDTSAGGSAKREDGIGTAQKDAAVTAQGRDGRIRELKLSGDGQLQAVVENADGSTRTVKAQELEAGESGLGELMEALQGRRDAAEMFRAYPSGMRIGDFVQAWDAAKAYGLATSTRTAESFLGDAMLRGVDQGVIKAAFAYGRSLRPPRSGRSESASTAGESKRAAEGVGTSSERGAKRENTAKAAEKAQEKPQPKKKQSLAETQKSEHESRMAYMDAHREGYDAVGRTAGDIRSTALKTVEKDGLWGRDGVYDYAETVAKELAGIWSPVTGRSGSVLRYEGLDARNAGKAIAFEQQHPEEAREIRKAIEEKWGRQLREAAEKDAGKARSEEKAAEGVGPYSAREREANTSSDTGTPSVSAASRRDSSPLGGAKGVSYDGATVDGRVLPKVNRAKLTAKQKAQIEVVQMLSEKFGIRFVLFESPTGKSGQYKGINGAYLDGVIYLDVKAGLYGPNLGQVAIVRTAAHELTHFIKDYAPAQFQELQDFLLDNLSEWKGKTLGDLAAQKLERDSTGKLSMEDALEEVVADGCEMMLQRTQVMQTLAQTKPTLYQKVKDWLKKWADTLREAFTGVSAVHDEARAVAEWEAKRLDHLVELWDKGLIEASENAQKSPAKEGGEAKQQERDTNGIVRSDVDEVRSIGRKSINLFTPSDIEKSRKWAEAYNKTLGSKSPFFRAWFGEWRSSSKQPVTVASIGEYKAGNEERKKQRGVTVNEDTGWEIRISREGETNTISHAGKDRLSELGLAGIRELVANAVLLDTEVHEHHDNNAADDRIAFDHRLYALGKNLNGTVALYRITVEETFQDYKHPNDKRFHNLKYIEKVADSIGSLTPDTSLDAESTNDASTTGYNISDLYGYVKQFDSDFNVNPHDDVSTALLNEDGTPKVFYHGTNAEFWAFDKKKATDKTGRLLGLGAGKGKFYLTEYQASAAMAASGAKARTGKGAERVMRLYVRAEKVMPRADYTKILDKYYQSIPNSRPGSAQYDYKQRDKAIAATDREVKAQGYDAVYDAGSGELFVYEASQMKSATDNIGTFDQSNPDIRFQERDELPTDRELLMAARAEGRNAEALTAYQKKVRSLEALERKLQRQMDALEAAKNREIVDAEGKKLDPKEQKAYNRKVAETVREQIRKTEASIARAEKALADMERSPQLKQETEKALAAWREANPHEAAKAIREMQQERDSLKSYVKLRREEARLTTPETRRMLPSDVRKMAQALVKEQGSEAAVDSITEKLQKLGDFMASNLEGAGVDYYNQIVNQARQIAKEIVDEAYETIDDNREIREGVRSYLRNHTLQISDSLRGDIPDFERWRKSHMGTLRLGKDGVAIDVAYQDLQSEYGEFFFPGDVTAPSDQLMRILDVLDMTQPTIHQMYSQYDAWQASEALGNEIVDRLLSGEVRERETEADKAFKRKMEQLEAKYARKDKARQKELENAEDRAAWEARKRDEAEEKRREERALRRQLVEERVHELRERSIERDKQYRARIAIDKKVVALSKIMLENSGKRHVPDPWKEAIGGFLASIDTLTQHSREESRSFHVQRIQALQEMVRKQQERNAGKEAEGEKGPQTLMVINPLIAEMLTPFVNMATDSSTGMIEVERLSLKQMRELEDVLVTLRKAVDTANSLVSIENGETVSEAAEKAIEYVEPRGEAKWQNRAWKRKLRKYLMFDNLTPVYYFKLMGPAGEQIFKSLRNGQGKEAFLVKQIIDFTNGTKTQKGAYTEKEVKSWENQTHEFELVKREADLSGRESLTKAAKEGGPEAVKKAEEKNKTKVTLSTAQLMGIYCLTKREQARGHILKGGIRVWDIETKKGTKTQADRYLVTAEDLAAMSNALTDRQKEVADALQRFMKTVGSKWGNEVSQKLYGVDLFTEENYYPIETDPKSRPSKNPEADNTDLFRLANMGFTKSPLKNASNGIVIHSIFDVFSQHMADMARYNAMCLPLIDAMKWFNYTDESDGKLTSVRTTLEKAFGQDAENYFLNLIQDINGGQAGKGEYVGAGMVSNMKIASVGANLRVAFLQPTSYVRAMAVLDPKYMLKFSNWQLLQGRKEALQYSGTANWKDLGFFDLNVSSNVKDMIKHADTAMDKIKEASMKGAELGDQLTWGALWNACKAETKAKTGLSGEELLMATAERFDDVVYETQVMDSVLTRSQMMRKKDAFHGMVTSFMAEPTLSYNLLLNSVMNWQTAKRSGQGIKAAWGVVGRAFATYALSQIVASLVESIFDAMRDDDDYEEWWRKILQAEFGRDGNLIEDLAPWSKLPYLRDLVSIWQGYTNKRMDTEWMNYWVQAIQALKKVVLKDDEGNRKPMTWNTAYKLVKALSTTTGLPIGNTERDAIALWNWFVVQNVPDWKMKNIHVTHADVKPLASIKQAYQAGALSEEAAIRYMLRDAEIESEDKARQKIREWSLEKGEKTYDQLLGALRSGKDGKAQREELLQSGYSEDAINSAVRDAAKAWFQGTAEDGKPRIGKEEAVRILVNQGGMKQEDAEARVREWTCYVSSPEQLQYSEIREAFLGGEITERRAVEMLTLYGGKSKDKAQAQIYQWKFAGMDEDFQDITESAAKYYYEQAEKTGMSEGVFYEAWSALKDIQAGDDTKKNKVAYISKLNIPARQKDTLFLLYYKESGLKDTPWH